MLNDHPHKIKHHASKITAYVTPHSTYPGAQRRGKLYFEFEFYVANGKLRADWARKAITLEEYLGARNG